MGQPPEALAPSAQRVQDALTAQGFACRVITLPTSARTAAEAAASLKCSVAQIVKSLVFRSTASNTAILVVASGANRVDESRMATYVGEPIAKADAAFVREHTSYAIGGVAPIGHPQPLRTFIDTDLLQFETIWAAAGMPNCVFALTPSDLQQMTGGTVVAIS